MKHSLIFITTLLVLTGCVSSPKQITLPNGQTAEKYTLFQNNDHRHLLARYSLLSYKRGLRMDASMINVPGSKYVTLKVKEYQINGKNFTLHPITLNGIKALSCKSSTRPGYAMKFLECKYDKASIRNSVLKNQQNNINGLVVDESPNGTLSEAWKCSKKYYSAYKKASNVLGRMSIRKKYQRECIEPVYFPNKTHRATLIPDGLIEPKFTYHMAVTGNKHYRFSVDKDNKKFLKFLSK